ncbi:hypothetical protein GE09DRAFT_1055693 [Coniochaeta sp. 2T2.1]|nr:hypothetical protein GE09DRAFT_1055693 [Coniochaeta sp. 2T2.1]
MDVDAQAHDASQGGVSGTDVKAWINWIQYSANRIRQLSPDEQLAAKLGEMEDEISEAEEQLRAAEEDERPWAATLSRVQEELAALHAERDQENARKRQRTC